MAILFFSYSHRDEALRNEIEIHLSQLKREGVIETWHDRRILAGDEIDVAISDNLRHADIVLLLVSPYFLASAYCNDIEMQFAMKQHEAKKARVIPVIAEFCDWHSTPFGKLLAVPTDGKPISKYPNQHEALLEVATAIRKAFPKATSESPQRRTERRPEVSETVTVRSDIPRSSNLRVQKSFTDQDRHGFLDDAFEYIAKFFEGSLQELQQRNPEISSRMKRIDATRFTAHLYRGGKAVGECSIRMGGFFGQGISYSNDAASTNSFNESLSLVDDGHTLSLKPAGLAQMSGKSEQTLTMQGAAELLWAILIRPLQ